jgi:hypothetical protein
MANHYLTAHEETDGPGGLDSDANVSFDIGGHGVVLVINDLKEEACETLYAGLPQHFCPLEHWVAHLWDTSGTQGESDWWTVSEN